MACICCFTQVAESSLLHASCISWSEASDSSLLSMLEGWPEAAASWGSPQHDAACTLRIQV